MAVLGTVVHEEQEARRGQALDETIEQGLGFAVDPMQVFEDHHQRLDLALAQQQALDRVERLLAPLEGIEGVPIRLVHRHVEERLEGRHGRAERGGERQDLPDDLLPDLPRVVATLDPEITAKQLDHGQVGGSLSVGSRGRLQDEPAVHSVGMGELPEEARLAHARLPDYCNNLAVSEAGLVEGVTEQLELDGASDEAGEAANGCRLQPRAHGPDSNDLVDLHGVGESLHRHRAERLHRNVALRQPESVGRCEDGAGLCHLFHASRQVRGLAHDGVVHVEIVADGTDYDLPRVRVRRGS